MDEVNAEHADCDLILHFGPSCLSLGSGRTEVLFVFERLALDIDKVVEVI